MERKSYTVILVPHARAKFRKFHVSSRQVLTAVIAFTLLTAASGFISWSYLTTPVDEAQVERLRNENQELRQVNQTFESNIRDLQSQLTEYEERTRKLAIVAGIEELGSGDESGIGGPDVGMDVEGLGGVAEISAQLGSLDGQLDRIESSLEQRFRWVSSTPSIAPTRGLFTSGYGPRRDPVNGGRGFHQGLDISAAAGKPVHATADGLVVRAGRIGRLGNAVYVSHGYGINTRYGHMSSLTVEPGQRVRRGDVIGYVGNSGRSTGYHLHYEVRKDGQPVNPLAYILDRPTAAR